MNHLTFGRRLAALDSHFNRIQDNHSNDPTGAEDEAYPLWCEVRQRLSEFQDNQPTCYAQQTAHHWNMCNVQQALGAQQHPLGAGMPPLCVEVAAENAPQLGGPQEIGAGMEMCTAGESHNN